MTRKVIIAICKAAIWGFSFYMACNTLDIHLELAQWLNQTTPLQVGVYVGVIYLANGLGKYIAEVVGNILFEEDK